MSKVFGRSYPSGCSGPPEPLPSAVELFEAAITLGTIKIEDEDSALLEQLYDLEAQSGLIEKFAAFMHEAGSNQAQSANAQWWDCYAEGKLREAGVSEGLLLELRSHQEGD